MVNLKVYRRFSTARKVAKGEPILRIGHQLYVVGITKADGFLTEIDLINGDGSVTGSVTARHLDRLGNANHAVAKRPYYKKIWQTESSGIGEG